MKNPSLLSYKFDGDRRFHCIFYGHSPHARPVGFSSVDKSGRVAPPERGFHLAAECHGRILRVIVDVGPAQRLAFADLALELDAVGEAERQEFAVERDVAPAPACPRRRNRPRRRAFRRLSDCAWRSRPRRSESRSARRSARCAARRRDGNAELEPDHVNRAIERGIFARSCPAADDIRGSSAAHIRFRPRTRHTCPWRDDAARRARRDRPTTSTSVTPAFSSVPPSLFGLQISASSKRLAGGKAKPAALRHEAGGVADRRHLDSRLGAVDEGIEHFRIDRVAVLDARDICRGCPTPCRAWSGDSSGDSACLCRPRSP